MAYNQASMGLEEITDNSSHTGAGGTAASPAIGSATGCGY